MATPSAADVKKMRVPDTLLIVFCLAIVAWGATYVLPKGQFVGDEGSFTLDSFESTGVDGAPVFGSGEGSGLLSFLFDGLVSGDRYSAPVGLMAFLLIVGGAFGIISKTRALERALTGFLSGAGDVSDWSLGLLFVLFSLAGAIFGMSEEAIVFVIILVPAVLRAGYDRVTAVMVAYIATQIGFATSWMNPFSVSVAQGIAGVPLISGWEFRVAMWTIFTALGAIWIVMRSRHVRLHHQPTEEDKAIAAEMTPETEGPMLFGHWLILGIVGLGVLWVAWGVAVHQYYFPEISTQFFTIGVASALVAIFLRLENLTANEAVIAFRDGAMALLPVALIIGAVKGIILILGGDSPDNPSVLNTMLYTMGGATEDLPPTISAIGMFLLQSVINLFVVSGSGQAALTMPIMAPLADLNGLERQIAVLAFQLGDGLTNIVVPASAPLIGCLIAAKVQWTTWISLIWKPFLLAMLLAMGFMFSAVIIGYS